MTLAAAGGRLADDGDFIRLAPGARRLLVRADMRAAVAWSFAFSLASVLLTTPMALAQELLVQPPPGEPGDATAVTLAAPGPAEVVLQAPASPEAPAPDPAARAWPNHAAMRLNLSATALFLNYARTGTSADNQDGLGLGGEVRVHPYSASGFLAGFQTGAGVFGPSVTVVDAAYSLRAFAPDRLKGVRPALYFDVGPSLGFVAANGSSHHDLGGRAGVAFDVQFWNLTAGVEAVYHGGLPVDGPSQWESSASVGVRLGVAFDTSRDDRKPEPTVASR